MILKKLHKYFIFSKLAGCLFLAFKADTPFQIKKANIVFCKKYFVFNLNYIVRYGRRKMHTVIFWG